MQFPDEFVSFFLMATGNTPYEYQRALGRSPAPPSVLEVPTGAGKTHAVLVAWLYERLVKRHGPRRLVYALPMRSLVEQTAAVAREIRARLELSAEDIPIRVLMGGESEDDWREQPERSQILVGTIDMLLSRALNRGYGESRFGWPVSFGLLNADCRWIFDEVQLMGPARATSAQLDGLRKKLGTALPCETMWVSATVDRAALQTVDRPDLGEVLRLSEEDRGGPLAHRLEATKVLEQVDLADEAPTRIAKRIAQLCLERHVPGTRTIAVVNTVREAQEAFGALQKGLAADGPTAVLLHSRFRPPDRARHLRSALGDPPPGGTVVVSTQVVEAGVDLTSRTLITAVAPFSSIVQRLGRCNRAGADDSASVLWLDRGPLAEDKASKKLAAPYAPIDLERSRTKLIQLEGQSLSPSRLEEVDVEETRDAPATLRRRDLLDLFDTAPDLSGTDIDVAPFIRADDDRAATVFFRDRSTGPPTEREPLPTRDESVEVPQSDLRARARARWVPDYVNGSWLPLAGNQLPPPGTTVMLDAAEGGYDPSIGWLPRAKAPVDPIRPEVSHPVEGMAHAVVGSEPEELASHLRAVAEVATDLADALALDAWAAELHAAAALHDVGKAHEVFQTLMRKAIQVEDDGRLWAKSGTRGGRYSRPYFRHELASALALANADGGISVPSPHLTRYLVGAHHGRVRVSIRPAPGESAPHGGKENERFALGVVDGDDLPPVETPLGWTPAVSLDLAPMELGAEDSWVGSALALRDDLALGPFRLGLLEAVVRIADWRASGA
jgi:CRISPR-associated endonuclease/helicase Cas3